MKFEVTRTATEVVTIDLPSVSEMPDDEFQDETREEFLNSIKELANHIDVPFWSTVESELTVEVIR